MNKLKLDNYNLHWTLIGGQSFAWDHDEAANIYYGFTQDKAVVIELKGDFIYWQTYPERDNFDFLQKYLRLDEDYLEILKKINKDKYIESAINTYPNLRLLAQDFEQTLLSFLLSANNNIRSIRRSIRFLNAKYGERINIGDGEIFLFPKTEVIANAPLEELLEAKIGFRAKFMKNAANHLINTDLSKEIPTLDENEARNALIKLNGVGDKIADCILVFALKKDNVTPLDVWGKRFLIQFYNLDPKMKYEDMRKWVADYFEGKASWAGQFLYEYIRNLPKTNNS